MLCKLGDDDYKLKWRDSVILYPCRVLCYLVYPSSLRRPISTAVTRSNSQSERQHRKEWKLVVVGWGRVLKEKSVCIEGNSLVLDKFCCSHVSDG
jgi:hypothetical protein